MDLLGQSIWDKIGLLKAGLVDGMTGFLDYIIDLLGTKKKKLIRSCLWLYFLLVSTARGDLQKGMKDLSVKKWKKRKVDEKVAKEKRPGTERAVVVE